MEEDYLEPGDRLEPDEENEKYRREFVGSLEDPSQQYAKEHEEDLKEQEGFINILKKNEMFRL